MSRITLGAHEQLEVELFGHVFTVNPVTKSLNDKIEKAAGEKGPINDLSGYVESLARALDLRLSTVEAKQPKASTVILKAWRADQVTAPQLDALVQDIGDRDRPT